MDGDGKESLKDELEEQLEEVDSDSETVEDSLEIEEEIKTELDDIEEEKKLTDDENENKDLEKEEVKDNDSSKDNKTRNIIIASVLGIILCIVLYFAYNIYSTVESYNDKVYPGVSLFDNDLSNLGYDELTNKIDEIFNGYNQNEILVKALDKEFPRTYSSFESSIQNEELANEILKYGKDKDFFDKYEMIKNPQKQLFEFRVNYSEEKLDEFINEIVASINKDAVNATIVISDGGDISLTDDSIGYKVNSEDLKMKINSLMEKPNVEKINIIECIVDENAAIITKDALSNVNTKISTFTTYFPGGPSGTNIQIGTTYLDNVLLMPGEEYSTLGLMGYTTPDKGYVAANTYENGKVVKNYGGGVCQIASTLYNTILRAGIIPLERTEHMFPVSYVPLGLDATLADDYLDLKFANPYDYPIYINAYAGGGQVTLEVWGKDGVLNGVNYVPKSYINGLSASTYLYGYDSEGNQVFEEYIDSSSYKPVPQN